MVPRLLAPLLLACTLQAGTPPYSVAPGLFDRKAPDLGLRSPPGARTATVWRAEEKTDHYANGACLACFKGRLYVQWQSSARDEDAADTWVAFASSADGEAWTAPQVLHPAGADGEMRSSGGWWTDGTRLVAFVNIWPRGFQSGQGGYTVALQSEDGTHWSVPRPVLDHDGRRVQGVIEQDIHAYGGRLHVAFHVQPGLTAKPHYTDDPSGLGGWTPGELQNLPHRGTTSREIEPSLFLGAEGLVMVFRDQDSTFLQLASLSRDRGRTWSAPVLTDMPDCRAKQSAGNMPDGTAYLVHCPSGSRERQPLALTLSPDGRRFTRSLLLRGSADLPPLAFPGKFKRPGYHYPKSLVATGRLWTVYATNKERIEITSVPLEIAGSAGR